MSSVDTLVTEFTQRAEKVGAVVSMVKSMSEAFAYTVDLCERKDACQLLLSGCGLPLSDAAGEMCEARTQPKVVAAPALAGEEREALAAACEAKGMTLISDGMRKHLAGIDIGFTVAEYGIAETGTIVQNSNSEELRLATMVSENHVAVLPVSRIRATSYDVEREFVNMVDASPSYMAFITGPSRTADIERVLALGVHGPLELHILLLEGE
ncbi:L-lactate dehydrogenase complex protein LldG [Desulfobaculum xiamenense]|uniref:L-lactate dehydrogenase complex protein LldG n=1 Tax=Desulfobaculum xiamenense TaxID=995050 RepID=A0A846QT03_9BACT|nr:lactate utilization protein [Desulfobaculum xiamenense]NJB68585.1 L-lactate dehydrogenase complex protein LldG [Desulfobaculum xiamenense]